LKSDLKWAENTVNNKVTYAIPQNQFDARIPFTLGLTETRIHFLCPEWIQHHNRPRVG
jgi:hypothetical protein